MDAQTRFQRFLKAALIPLFVVATALPMAVAQTLTGSLSGTVVDSSDAVLPGATVTLVNDLSGDQRTTVTNEAGNFVFAAVQAGTYTVKVELSGFQAIETKGIVLRLGEKRNLTGIKLGVAGLSEQVAVTAVTELAPVSSGEKSVSISGEQIQNTAIVGRSAAELLKILPGMAPSNGGSSGAPSFNGEVYGINGNGEGGKQSAIGNYSSNGTNNNSLDIVIDGAHATDPGCNCATSVNPNPDMVEEFKVLQANFGAENAKGPTTINVVSKAGGRDFRGTAYTYLRHYSMNANEWFLNKVDDSGVRSAEPAEEQVLFPGVQPRWAAPHSRHRFQQEPRQVVLLLRLRVLQAGPRHRHAAVVGTDAGDAERRLLGRGVHEPARRRRREKSAVVRWPGSGQPNRSERPDSPQPDAAAEHQPGAGQWLQLRAERTAVAEQPPGARPRRLQRQRQHQAVLPLQLPGGGSAIPGRSLVAQRQPGAVSDLRRRRQPLTLGDHEFDQGLWLDA